jgi:hypothetical protein
MSTGMIIQCEMWIQICRNLCPRIYGFINLIYILKSTLIAIFIWIKWLTGRKYFYVFFFLNFSLKGTVVKFYKESVSGCWADAKLLYNLLYWTDPTWYDSNCINHKQVSNVSIPANLSFLHQLSLKLVITKCFKNWWTAIKTFNLVRNLLITIKIQYGENYIIGK